jgi:hypothetical protein
MTVLAIAEQIRQCLGERARSIKSEKTNGGVTLTVEVGEQAFVVTVAELAKDHDSPAIS